MKSFVKIALFAIVAANAIRINKDDPADSDKKEKGITSAEEEAVGKFAFKKADEADRIKQTNITTPYVKPKSQTISEDW